MRIRGSYAIIKIFWGMRGMEDRSSSRYKHFNSWIIFLKSLTVSWSPIFPPVMGEVFGLWVLLHQSEGFAEGRERQRWGQWLQPDPCLSYTSTTNAGMNIFFTNNAIGQEIPLWEQIPAVPWHLQNTSYVSERGSIFPFITEGGRIASPARLTSFNHHFHLHISTGTHLKSNPSSEVTQWCMVRRPALTPEGAQQGLSSAFSRHRHCQEHWLAPG